MVLIEKYVKDYGGGFVMTCGTNITAEGGYSDTKTRRNTTGENRRGRTTEKREKNKALS